MAGTITSVTAEHRTRGVVKQVISITCDASGDASATVTGVAFGALRAIGYKPGTLDTGADITIADGETGTTLVTLTNAGTSARYFRPTRVITDNVGTAVAAALTAVNVNRDIYVGGKLKVTVAQGGNLGAGTLYLVIDESDVSFASGNL